MEQLKKIKRMVQELKEYLKKEWKYNNHNKYQKYFDEWVKNLTNNQIYHFRKQMIKAKKKNYEL